MSLFSARHKVGKKTSAYNPMKGQSLMKGLEYQHQKGELARKFGMSDPDEINLQGDVDANLEAISKYSGYTWKAFDDEDREIKGVPLELEGEPYETTDKGIRIIAGSFVKDIVRKQLAREEKIEELMEFFLCVGDIGVASISKDLYTDMKGHPRGDCRPSAVKYNPPDMAVRITNMKQVINAHIDKMPIPKDILKEFRTWKKKQDSLDARHFGTLPVGAEAAESTE